MAYARTALMGAAALLVFCSNAAAGIDRCDLSSIGLSAIDESPPRVGSFFENRRIFDTHAFIVLLDGTQFCEFGNGEFVGLVVRITNRSRSIQRLEFSTTKVYDFYVLQPASDQIVWRWSDGQAFDDAFTELFFGPAETKVFTAVWNQRDYLGLPVPLGAYDVVGSIEGEGAPPADFDERSPTLSHRNILFLVN